MIGISNDLRENFIGRVCIAKVRPLQYWRIWDINVLVASFIPKIKIKTLSH